MAEPSARTLVIPPETRRKQEQASNPGISAWVSANAGSGKTTVLVRRVKRLLLAGVPPERILCLTYTTAAASNMANRLFADLAAWVTADDAKLDRELEATLGRTANATERNRARRLFADAIETPGGLKLQTIHAFCTRLLQGAPLEAGVPARFEIIGDEDAVAARRAALETVLRRAEAGDAEPNLSATVARLTAEVQRDDLIKLIAQANPFADRLLDGQGRARTRAALAADLARALDVDPTLTHADIASAAMARIARLLDFADFAAHAIAIGTDKQKIAFADLREAWMAARDAAARIAIWCDALLTGERDKINGNLAKTTVFKAFPAGPAALEAVADVLFDHVEQGKRLALHEASLALFGVAGLALQEYERRKRALGALDYADLIARAGALLAGPEGAFLLYKLDGRLDHVLIDEAQDTSPAQWTILNALTAEFGAGAGARGPAAAVAELARTVFAVGDEKQSIYSFQGAAPAAFGEQRGVYRQALDRPEYGFADVRLTVSFRSASAVMRGVDAVFANPDAHRGLSADGDGGTVHESARPGMPGRIELWDLIEDAPTDEREVWLRPIDAVGAESATAQLARTIAATLRAWTARGRDDAGRPFAPGDVLILLRNRNAAFREIVSALRREGVPVAGVDRLTVAAHMAVCDMLALARAALNPEDDLTLATVLKGPLIGLDEDALFALAHGRRGSLREALASRAASSDGASLAMAEATLRRVEALACRSGPFAFFAGALALMGGRREAVSRFGPEAHDVLDALLDQARRHEQQRSASLADFVLALSASEADVKRDLSAPGSEVRVMTVHGAKGLEARIVILADIALEPSDVSRDSPLFVVGDQGRAMPVWSPRKKADCAAVAAERQRRLDLAIDEHRRLLYVALTRAEERLILCGVKPSEKFIKRLGKSWYGLVEAGLTADGGLEPCEPLASGLGRRLHRADGAGVAAGSASGVDAAPERRETGPVAMEEPAWLRTPAVRERPVEPPLSPASALAAAEDDAVERARDASRPTVPGGFDTAALERGRLTHLLLQWLAPLPDPQRRAAGARVLAARAPHIDAATREGLLDAALGVFAHPDAAALFGPGSRAEVSLAGSVMTAEGPRPLSGRIDRLLVTPDAVEIADFKTARRVPREVSGVEPATLAQLALYAVVAADLYPGRTVTARVIYTAGPAILTPAASDLRAALAAITQTSA
jgi:ATP-dependent helicase/nuclease subunit A